MVQALQEYKQRMQVKIESLQGNQKRGSPSIRIPATIGGNEVSPLHQEDEESPSLSTTPKSQSVEEEIGNFSSPLEEFPFVPATPGSDSELEKEEASNKHEIGTLEKHTKGMGMRLVNNMGYQQGKGLNKHGQGKLQPIYVQEMPKYKGLGYDQ